MFKQLSSLLKGTLFYGIALGLIRLVLLIYRLQKQPGAEPMALSALEAQ